MPQRSRRAFELAANIHPADSTGDRQLLLRHLGNLYIRILLPDRPPPISNTSSVHMPSSFVQNRHIDNLSRVGLATGALVISLAAGRCSRKIQVSVTICLRAADCCVSMIWKRLLPESRRSTATTRSTCAPPANWRRNISIPKNRFRPCFPHVAVNSAQGWSDL